MIFLDYTDYFYVKSAMHNIWGNKKNLSLSIILPFFDGFSYIR